MITNIRLNMPKEKIYKYKNNRKKIQKKDIKYDLSYYIQEKYNILYFDGENEKRLKYNNVHMHAMRNEQK